MISILWKIANFAKDKCNRSMAKEKVKIDNPFINDVEVLFLLQALQEIASNMEKRLNMN